MRISRRAFVAGAVGATALAALRCGGDNDETSPSQPTPTLGPLKRGGVFSLGTTVPALSIDPHTEVTMGLAFVCFIYGYLLHESTPPGSAPTLVFDHAEALEQPDDLTFIFKMRQGVRFQDLPPVGGREITAEDAHYSFQRIASLQSTPFWTDGIRRLSVPDSYTFAVDTASPYAYTMEEFGGIRTAIVPKEAVEQFGDLKTHGRGSGPFQLPDLTRGETVDMVSNPDYYVPGIPYIDIMRWRIMADDSSLQAAFKSRQLDTYGPPSRIQADQVTAYSDKVLVSKYPNLAITMINLNEISAPVLQDIRVREALDLSLDRDAMIEKLCFGDGNYTGPVSWGLDFWSLPQDELRRHYKRDVAKARQLLDGAGVSDLTLSMKFPAGPTGDVAAMIKAQAAEAGITINLISEEFGTWIADLMGNNYELLVGGGLPYGNEHLPLQFNHTKNWTRKAEPVQPPDPEVDAILDKILVTTDISERQKLALDVTRKILARHGPFMYLYAPYSFTARWDYLRGYEDLVPDMLAYTYDMWLDK
jgi:peptide/nickel transport system substrate-binding protein